MAWTAIKPNKLIQRNDTWAYRLVYIPFLVKSICTYTARLSCITIFTCAFPITITSLTLWTSLVTVAFYKVEPVNQKHKHAYHCQMDKKNLLVWYDIAIYYAWHKSDRASKNSNKLYHSLAQVYARNLASSIQCYCKNRYKLHFHLALT